MDVPTCTFTHGLTDCSCTREGKYSIHVYIYVLYPPFVSTYPAVSTSQVLSHPPSLGDVCFIDNNTQPQSLSRVQVGTGHRAQGSGHRHRHRHRYGSSHRYKSQAPVQVTGTGTGTSHRHRHRHSHRQTNAQAAGKGKEVSDYKVCSSQSSVARRFQNGVPAEEIADCPVCVCVCGEDNRTRGWMGYRVRVSMQTAQLALCVSRTRPGTRRSHVFCPVVLSCAPSGWQGGAGCKWSGRHHSWS
ncbi:hypothetical protein DFP73DRAFT_558023 [Morchella snyderi]|nr:hypothetical protein DFP73DRAFT_558023 [Morchella snyderi]